LVVSPFDLFQIGIGPSATKYKETARGGLALNVGEC
jgi:hypothetical protein